ncbi:hypothetical protein TVAG_301320 [Trichomonas vaginalis G3]|uniref:Uncharacterized protein n=1 Tax=Trichomonas vaginalis (strain ATCC PRA-98 / G3) TaxID=412133 RepID=A2E5F4_TRIV3|nr:tetratricopeptide repeat domain domain-containing protein [Trichomonas vaginalis G3]EAY12115.1 hypothetical protein TVAG_301320 [Trichomonas vaginalis G3]KAI5542406.1 tetratricopeptide repeat domain domain-containing protein [Trichomonas vaginalis G3]|eukprot:XP_001324338.1 hypothetical protein [Trichomonas vaginalis G3]
MQHPNFIRIPCGTMHRIFTWYHVAIDFNTQPMINCFYQMANLYGMAATPLFLLFDYSLLPEEIITFIQGMTVLDRDVIGPLVHYHFKKSAAEKTMLVNQINNLESEYQRYQMIYSQTEQRNRILISKTTENESRKQSLVAELQDIESKCSDLQQSLDNIRANSNKSNDILQKSVIDTRQTNMDIDDMELNIQALKKQLEDSAQLKAQLAQQQQELEKKMFNDDKKVFNSEQTQEQESSHNEIVVSRENYVEPLLKPVDFNDKDFETAFINKNDLKFDLAVTPSLKYSLDTEGTLRMAELHILWRNCQNGNARALTDYGTHILRTDPLSFDLGMNYLEMAVEHDEPYALYNLASLIQNGKIGGTKEEVAFLLAKAAKFGEPNSVSIVKSCVKVVEL